MVFPKKGSLFSCTGSQVIQLRNWAPWALRPLPGGVERPQSRVPIPGSPFLACAWPPGCGSWFAWLRCVLFPSVSLALAMLSRDPLVLQALASLSSKTLATLDAMLSEVGFFHNSDPVKWHGEANLHFRMDSAISPTLWACTLFSTGLPPDLHATPRARRVCFAFELESTTPISGSSQLS